jgi:hypothetical protein
MFIILDISLERKILDIQFMTFSTGDVPFVNVAKRNSFCVASVTGN